jgi:hypothetical protein
MGEKIAIAALIIFLACSAWFSLAEPSSVNGLTPVEQTKPHIHWWRGKGDGDGKLSIKPPKGVPGPSGSLVMLNGQAYEDPDSPAQLETKYTPDIYVGDPGLDLGTWAGLDKGGHELEIGVRYSPARFLFGMVAPDLVLSQDVVGAGVSVFPPPQYVGSFWRHIGIGAWDTVPYRNDARGGWRYGLSFSTRF